MGSLPQPSFRTASPVPLAAPSTQVAVLPDVEVAALGRTAIRLPIQTIYQHGREKVGRPLASASTQNGPPSGPARIGRGTGKLLVPYGREGRPAIHRLCPVDNSSRGTAANKWKTPNRYSERGSFPGLREFSPRAPPLRQGNGRKSPGRKLCTDQTTPLYGLLWDLVGIHGLCNFYIV